MSNDSVEDRRRATRFEHHAQTALTLVVVALLVWVASTAQSTQIKVAELSVEVNNLKNIVRTPEARVNDLTRRIDALEAIFLPQGEPTRE